MSCFITTDNNWDNYPIIEKRIKKLKDDIMINACYGKTLPIIDNICSKYNKRIFRRTLKDNQEIKDLCDILVNCSFCIVFTDFIEYNTLSSITIKICIDNNIPVF